MAHVMSTTGTSLHQYLYQHCHRVLFSSNSLFKSSCKFGLTTRLCFGNENNSNKFSTLNFSNFLQKWKWCLSCYHHYMIHCHQQSSRCQLSGSPINDDKNGSLLTIDKRICTTYATADQYRFTSLVNNVSLNGRFKFVNLPIDVTGAAIFSTSDESVTVVNENGYVVLFKEGAISFWNISPEVITQFLEMTHLHEKESYKTKLVQWEKEQMEYKFISKNTRLYKNCFEIANNISHERTCCEIFAFSNALMTSVKLAHWEQSLDSLIQSIETLPQDLMKGKYFRSYSSKTVLSKVGEVLMMRHRLNLKYNMLDIPDVYWDEEDLEKLYVKTTEFLNIQRRVDVMNEKLSYCAHVVELVKSHMAEQKSVRIEILIVILILIEVLFEVIHFYVKPYLEKQRSNQFKEN